MAHSELISKYAQQVTEANLRIVELEVAIADARSEWEAVKAATILHQHGDGEEVCCLCKELQRK